MAQPILFLQKCLKINFNFKDALLLAQQLGFAESILSLDVEGWDAVNKWVILLAHAYGIVELSNKYCFYMAFKIFNEAMQMLLEKNIMK